MNEFLLFQATLWVSGIIVVYAVLSRGLFLSAERARARALDLAVELDSSFEVPDEDKAAIRYTLGEFHSARAAWGLALSAVVFLFKFPFQNRSRVTDPADKMPRETRTKFNAYRSCWISATLANSLGATVVFVVALLLGTAFSMSTDAFKAAVANSHDHHGNGHAKA